MHRADLSEIISGLVMGLSFIALGWAIGFGRPTAAEQGVPAESLRWGRRPENRKRMGIIVILCGIVVIAIRTFQVVTR